MSKESGAYPQLPSAPADYPPGPPSYDQATNSNTIGFVNEVPRGYPAPIPQQPCMKPPEPVYTAQPSTIVITSSPHVVVGPRQMRMQCPNCHQQIATETETDYLCAAHFCCLAMFIFGLFLCSCIPYCMDSCRSVSHKCPNCKCDLGTYVPS